MVDLSPNYFDQFSCLGSECIDSCCQGLKIDVDQNCHKKYQELNKDNNDNLEKFLKKSTNPSNSNFSFIEMKKNGFCPFLDKTNLCNIQKKFGEDYLPNTCKVFPRRTIDFDEIKIKTLSLACPEAARLCLTQKNSMAIKSNQKKNNFIKIVPSYLHNSFSEVGEKLFNKIYYLFRDENFSLPHLLIICETILNEQKNLKKNPKKIDQVFNFIVNESKNLDYLEYDRSFSKINFLTDLNNFIKKTNPNCSLNKILSKIENKLVKNNSDAERKIHNFKNIRKEVNANFKKESESIFRNYFLNEILGHAQVFTNETPKCRNRFYITILCAAISKLITTESLSRNNKNKKKILLDSIQKVMKNFGAFVLVDNNQEYELHPEILSALKKVDENSIFNSLFLLYA